MQTKNPILVKKIFENRSKMRLPPQAWVEMTINEVETHWFFSKEAFGTPVSKKKVMLTVFLDMKGSITIDFLEKGATINGTSFCQLPRQISHYLLNISGTIMYMYIYIRTY